MNAVVIGVCALGVWICALIMIGICIAEWRSQNRARSQRHTP